MYPDPFWKRSGFWAALCASVPLAFAVVRGAANGDFSGVSQELVIATLGAWGAFVTGAVVRPSIAYRTVQASEKVVREIMAEQQDRIRQLGGDQ